ncbi:MAG: hypothetical protein AAF721_20180, partial [Myxococcota bacterium]
MRLRSVFVSLCCLTMSLACGTSGGSTETANNAMDGTADSGSSGGGSGQPTSSATDGSDGADSTDGSGGAMGCDAPNPECTTGNACGNDEICVDCMCVPTPDECPDPIDANCVTSDDCPSGETCDACQCTADGCGDPKIDECMTSLDCPRGEECGIMNTEGCVCLFACECGGDDDPEG